MPPGFTFIQSSDLHLGKNLEKMGDFAPVLEKAILDTFELIVSYARKESVDAFLISGNLFDTPKPPEEIARFVVEKLASLKPIKVYISPGSFDPCVEGSIYLESLWPDNVHIFTTEKFSEICIENRKVILNGFAHTIVNQTANPLSEFRPATQEGYMRIMLFNGSITDAGLTDPNPVALFKFQDLIDSECDYAALGHFNKIQSLKLKGEKIIRGCYSGMPQAFDFADDGVKGFVKVSIEGEKRDIKFIPTARIKFQNLVIGCNMATDENEVIARISRVIEGKNFKGIALKIILVDSLDMEHGLDMEKIKSSVCPQCAFFEIENNTVVGYDFEKISLEQSSRGLFAKIMLEEIQKISGFTTLDEKTLQSNQEAEIYELAMRYGLDSLSRGEVKKRWL